jgi:hypothetical protein
MLYNNGGCCDTRGRCIVKNSQGNYVAGGEWREVINGIINITPVFFVVGPNGDSLSITEAHEQGTVQKMMRSGNTILATGQLEKDDAAPDNTILHHTDIALYVLQDNGQLLNTSIRYNNAIALQTPLGYVTSHWSSGGLMSSGVNDIIIYGQGAHLPASSNSADQNTFIAKLTPGTTGIPVMRSEGIIEVFPNPVTDLLTINVKSGAGVITITNLFGQQVYRGEVVGTTIINTEAWVAGTYLIQSNNGSVVYRAKVIKQ